MAVSALICVLLLLIGLSSLRNGSLAYVVNDKKVIDEPLFEVGVMESINSQKMMTNLEEIIQKSQLEQEIRLFETMTKLMLVVRDQQEEKFNALTKIVEAMSDKIDQLGISTRAQVQDEDSTNKIYIRRLRREYGKYLGCFEDHQTQRMFLGYAADARVDLQKENGIETCLKICKERRFVYAGVQDRDWCHCGNTFPNTTLNKRLNDAKCNSICFNLESIPGYCGGELAMSVYETGIEEYRLDETGTQIDESEISTNEVILKTDCDSLKYPVLDTSLLFKGIPDDDQIIEYSDFTDSL